MIRQLFDNLKDRFAPQCPEELLNAEFSERGRKRHAKEDFAIAVLEELKTKSEFGLVRVTDVDEMIQNLKY